KQCTADDSLPVHQAITRRRRVFQGMTLKGIALGPGRQREGGQYRHNAGGHEETGRSKKAYVRYASDRGPRKKFCKHEGLLSGEIQPASIFKIDLSVLKQCVVFITPSDRSRSTSSVARGFPNFP